jgi:FkbM family methyltransferase
MHLYDILEDRFARDIFVRDEYPQATGVVLDIGALNGEFALYTYNTADRIICLEPEPRAYERLSFKVDEYDLNKIKVYDYALDWQNDGAWINDTSVEGGTILRDGPPHNDIRVKTITLRKLMELEKINIIDFLKIDIEGYEHQLFIHDFPWDKIKHMCGEHIDLKDVQSYGFERDPNRYELYHSRNL